MSTSLTRRKLFRYLGMVTGSLILSKLTSGSEVNVPLNIVNKIKGDIIYRTLGRTGLKVPLISIGVSNITNTGLVTAALNGGIIHLDTAHIYQNGRNEEMLGNLLKTRSRNSYIIATKINPQGKELSVSEFIEKVKTSLKRLQMDYVDILYLHDVNNRETVLNKNHLNALKELKNHGKVRFTGVSTHNNMPEVIQAAMDSNLYDIVLTSYNFKLTNLQEMNSLIEKAANRGMGIIGMKTMAGVYWDKERTRPINARAALKWVLQNENIHTTIPGFRTYDELNACLEVMRDITMSLEEKNDLKDNKQTSGMFCSGCNQCLAQCKKGLPVPELMRAYMYAYGYNDLALAMDVLDSNEIVNDLCGSCNECIIHCPAGFNIAQKTTDILRLRQITSDYLS